jgi:hypothetical protein
MPAPKAIRLYLLLSLVWILLAFFSSKLVAGRSLYTVMLLCLLIGLPLFVSLAYGTTVRKLHQLLVLAPDGYMWRKVSARFLRFIVTAFIAYALALWTIVSLQEITDREWMFVFAALATFPLLYELSHHVLKGQVNTPYLYSISLAAARLLTAAVLTFLYIAALIASPPFVQQGAAAPEWNPEGSQLIAGIIYAVAKWQQIKIDALKELSALGFSLNMFLLVGSCFAFLYSMCLGLCTFRIPAAELKRLWIPLDEMFIARPPLPREFFSWAFGLVIVLAGSAHLIGSIEQRVTESRRSNNICTLGFNIDDGLYKQAIIPEKEDFKWRFAMEKASHDPNLHAYFAEQKTLLVSGIEPFMDEYYSLVPEMRRLHHLLTGAAWQSGECWVHEELTGTPSSSVVPTNPTKVPALQVCNAYFSKVASQLSTQEARRLNAGLAYIYRRHYIGRASDLIPASCSTERRLSRSRLQFVFDTLGLDYVAVSAAAVLPLTYILLYLSWRRLWNRLKPLAIAATTTNRILGALLGAACGVALALAIDLTWIALLEHVNKAEIAQALQDMIELRL